MSFLPQQNYLRDDESYQGYAVDHGASLTKPVRKCQKSCASVTLVERHSIVQLWPLFPSFFVLVMLCYFIYTACFIGSMGEVCTFLVGSSLIIFGRLPHLGSPHLGSQYMRQLISGDSARTWTESPDGACQLDQVREYDYQV